ncbi:MAG: hypothetical protein O6940_04845 [Ignavibacteria bacterium]|nr:hypothetical protein [Ignavibacteria bacterium]
MQWRIKRRGINWLFIKLVINCKKLSYPIIFIFFLTHILPQNTAQAQWFSLPTYWKAYNFGVRINIEAFGLNKDIQKDLFISNFYSTVVYYSGNDFNFQLDNECIKYE